MAVPEKLVNARVYREGERLVGIADVELPEIEFVTETVSGLGVAGEVESPTLGHFKPMVLKLKWRTKTPAAAQLLAPKAHQLDIQASIQEWDQDKGTYATYPVKVVVKAIPKKGSLGKLEPGKPQDAEQEFEVTYIKVWVKGQEMIEADKYNFIYKVDGVDYLESVRRDLGE